MPSEPGSITTLVNDLRVGASRDSGDSLSSLYDSLSGMARDRVRRLGVRGEIRTGDLVNEVYLKLFGRESEVPWESRRHFYGAAARAMQQVIVDLIRRIEVRREHAPRIAVPLEKGDVDPPTLALPALIDMLDHLDRVDPVAAEVVRMRVFAGLSVEEAARVLDLPLRTAQRKWTIGRGLAHAWLVDRMD